MLCELSPPRSKGVRTASKSGSDRNVLSTSRVATVGCLWQRMDEIGEWDFAGVPDPDVDAGPTAPPVLGMSGGSSCSSLSSVAVERGAARIASALPLRPACLGCRRAKVRCDRGNPCGKCKSRKIPCIQQELTRRVRTFSLGAVGSHDAVIPRTALLDAPCAGPMESRSTTPSTVETVATSSFLSAIMNRIDQLKINRLFDARKARFTLEAWSLVAEREGAGHVDVPWAQVDELARFMSMSIHHEGYSTGTYHSRYGVSMEHVESGLGHSMLKAYFPVVAATAVAAQVFSSSLFKVPPGPAPRGLVQAKKSADEIFERFVLDDGVSALALLSFGGAVSGVFGWSVNERFNRLFASPNDISTAATNDHKLILTLLGSSLVVPEDQEEYYNAVSDLFFTSNLTTSRILQVRTRHGTVVGCILRLRLLPVAELTSVCLVLALEPLPVTQRYHVIPMATSRARQPAPNAWVEEGGEGMDAPPPRGYDTFACPWEQSPYAHTDVASSSGSDDELDTPPHHSAPSGRNSPGMRPISRKRTSDTAFGPAAGAPMPPPVANHVAVFQTRAPPPLLLHQHAVANHQEGEAGEDHYVAPNTSGEAKDAPSPTLSELCNMLGWEADHPSNPPTWDGSDDLPQDKPRGAGPQGVREIHAV